MSEDVGTLGRALAVGRRTQIPDGARFRDLCHLAQASGFEHARFERADERTRVHDESLVLPASASRSRENERVAAHVDGVERRSIGLCTCPSRG